jgi:hypothetical protein
VTHSRRYCGDRQPRQPPRPHPNACMYQMRFAETAAGGIFAIQRAPDEQPTAPGGGRFSESVNDPPLVISISLPRTFVSAHDVV